MNTAIQSTRPSIRLSTTIGRVTYVLDFCIEFFFCLPLEEEFESFKHLMQVLGVWRIGSEWVNDDRLLNTTLSFKSDLINSLKFLMNDLDTMYKGITSWQELESLISRLGPQHAYDKTSFFEHMRGRINSDIRDLYRLAGRIPAS